MNRVKKRYFGKPLSGLLVALCVTGVLLWVIMMTGRDLSDWLASETWAATQSTDFVRQSKTSQIRYTYIVNDQAYTGDRVRFFEWLLYSEGHDLDWQHTHPTGSVVTVYYDPQDPQRSVLVREIDPERVTWLTISLVYGCLALLSPFFLIGLSWWILRRLFRGQFVHILTQLTIVISSNIISGVISSDGPETEKEVPVAGG